MDAPYLLLPLAAASLAAASVFLPVICSLPAGPPDSEQARAVIQRIEEKIARKESIARELYEAQVYRETWEHFYDWFQRAPDPESRFLVLDRMAGKGMPHLDQAVLAAVHDPNERIWRKAYESLYAAQEHPEALDLIRAHLHDPDPELRWLAARNLAMAPRALRAMPEEAHRLASDPDAMIRQAFLAHIAAGEGVAAIAVPLLVEAAGGRDAMTRMAAARSLQRLEVFAAGQPDARLTAIAGRAREDLGAADPSLAGAASYVLLALWNPTVEERVRTALASSNLLLRARAADLLRKRKLAFDPAPLAELFRAGAEEAQLSACGTLRRIPTETCVPVLQAALQSRSPAVRQAAVYALEPQASPAAIAALTGALEHADANVRRRAAIVLGRLGARQASARLEAVAQADRDADVREAARIAAAEVMGQDLAPVLVAPEKLLAGAGRQTPSTRAPTAGQPTVVRDGVLQVGSQKQLFVDDLLLADRGGASRVLHPFRKDARNPVLEQQFPWELRGTSCYCTTVRYDPGTHLFTCWYSSTARLPREKRGFADEGRVSLLGYSRDGVHWLRPNLGALEYDGTRANNRVGSASNIVPIPDASDPARRYASYLFAPDLNALAVAYSPDGIAGWSAPKAVLGGGKDVVTACRDDLGSGYFAFMKTRVGRWVRRSAHTAWGAAPDAMRRGLINVVAGFADDRGAAERIAAAAPGLDFLDPTRFHTEIYEVTPFIYEGFYFGLPARFDVSGPGAANVDGALDLCLIASRDRFGAGGWIRPGPGAVPPEDSAEGAAAERMAAALSPVLERGRWGEWDSVQLYGPNSVLVVDDEIVLYYTGADFGHEPEGSQSDWTTGGSHLRTAIGRATLRLDGFVSLRAGDQEAVITTRPLVFTGKDLVLNADCPRGALAVELLGADGNPLPGFTRRETDPFTGDALRHVATWRHRSDVSALAGRPVRLRFFLRNGDLYSFVAR